MSFFKKLKEEFGGSSEQSQTQNYQQQGGHSQYPPQDQYNRPQQPPQHSSYGQQPQYGQPQQPQYGQPPPVPYGSRDPYGQPPSQYGGGSPAPGYGPRPGDNGYNNAPYGAPPQQQQQDPNRPPVPGQWVPLFSEQHQRWYFVETTGRSLWDAPAYIAPQAPMPAYGDYHGSSRGADGGYASGTPGGEYRGDGQGGGYAAGGEPEKKDNDKRNMMLAAGGALAVGVIGGAVIAEALDDDDDDEHRAAAAASAPALEPTPMPGGGVDAYGNPISEDDRESIQEAREEYQEELADSDASASDVEEAREEYQEEVDDAYYEE